MLLLVLVLLLTSHPLAAFRPPTPSTGPGQSLEGCSSEIDRHGRGRHGRGRD